MRFSLLGIVVLLVGGCSSVREKPSPQAASSGTSRTAAEAAVDDLAAKRWEDFAAYIHPTKGVCFSPYPEECKKPLSQKAFLQLARGRSSYRWGNYDGSGEPIELTLDGYAARFINDRKFASAPQVVVDKYVFRGGNLFDPLTGRPGASLVEFHFPSKSTTVPDWKSLRLVLERVGERWYITVVQHDEWTI